MTDLRTLIADIIRVPYQEGLHSGGWLRYRWGAVPRILEYIGESTDPPRLSPARWLPAWEGQVDSKSQYDSIAQPEADFQFDQTQGW